MLRSALCMAATIIKPCLSRKYCHALICFPYAKVVVMGRVCVCVFILCLQCQNTGSISILGCLSAVMCKAMFGQSRSGLQLLQNICAALLCDVFGFSGIFSPTPSFLMYERRLYYLNTSWGLIKGDKGGSSVIKILIIALFCEVIR